MTIRIESTSDTPENVAAAMGPPKTEEKKEVKAAPGATGSEQKETPESDTEETEAKADGEDDADPEDSKESGQAGESEQDVKDGKDDKPKRKSGFQRRVDKLNARIQEREREVEHWRTMALKSAGGEPKTEKIDDAKADQTGKPNPEKFDTHAEYVEAITDWKLEQREKAREEEAHKSKLKTDHEARLNAHLERVKSFAEKTDDFEEVISELDDVSSLTIQEVILSSEHSAELLYELAKNKAEAVRISKLPPLAAARELGKIESRIASQSSEEKPGKKTTNAPKPIAPVGGKGGTVDKSIYDQNLSQREYEALRAKQRKAAAS